MQILFIPFTPSLAHITRCLSIAETMQMRGNECLFAIGAEGKNFIEKAGFKTRIVPEVDSKTFKNDRGWKWLTKKYFQDNLDAEIAIIDEFNPDIVIFDFRFTTALAARIKSKRSICIIHASALQLIFEPKKAALDLIASDDSGAQQSIREKIFQFVFPKIFCWFQRKPLHNLRPILKKYNCSVKSVFEFLVGDLNFIADIPEFISKELKLPENFHVIGPLTWTGWEKESDFSFKGLDDRPMIYVTMGSTVEAKQTLLKLIESLKDMPYHIILSKGDMELNLPEIPKNVHIYSYVPGKVIASKSSLVIYHGGHETLMQVLSAGVPSLVIPMNPDQVLVAKQIKKTGIGNYLKHPDSFPMDLNPLKNFTIDDITNQINQIIHDKECKQRCEALKKTMDNYITSKEYLRYLYSIHV